MDFLESVFVTPFAMIADNPQFLLEVIIGGLLTSTFSQNSIQVQQDIRHGRPGRNLGGIETGGQFTDWFGCQLFGIRRVVAIVGEFLLVKFRQRVHLPVLRRSGQTEQQTVTDPVGDAVPALLHHPAAECL